MTKDELIKSYKKRKAALEIYMTGILVTQLEKVRLNIQIQCFSIFIEDLEKLNDRNDP